MNYTPKSRVHFRTPFLILYNTCKITEIRTLCDFIEKNIKK